MTHQAEDQNTERKSLRLIVGPAADSRLWRRPVSALRTPTLFHDLKLMEKEGSGFDLMYDVQLSQGRAASVPEEGPDSFQVTVDRRLVKPEIVGLLTRLDAAYQLSQRERISLALLAVSDGMSAREFMQRLGLSQTEPLVSTWLGRLPALGLVSTSGRTRGFRYFVDPRILDGEGFAGRTTLSRMSAHRLRALIEEDLLRFPKSSSGEINARIGAEVPYRTLKRAIDDLVLAGKVRHRGGGRGRRYWPVDPEETNLPSR